MVPTLPPWPIFVGAVMVKDDEETIFFGNYSVPLEGIIEFENLLFWDEEFLGAPVLDENPNLLTPLWQLVVHPLSSSRPKIIPTITFGLTTTLPIVVYYSVAFDAFALDTSKFYGSCIAWHGILEALVSLFCYTSLSSTLFYFSSFDLEPMVSSFAFPLATSHRIVSSYFTQRFPPP